MRIFWESPGRRLKRPSGAIRVHCRSTIWATGTLWKLFATPNGTRPGYFLPEIIWKAPRLESASKMGFTLRKRSQATWNLAELPTVSNRRLRRNFYASENGNLWRICRRTRAALSRFAVASAFILRLQNQWRHSVRLMIRIQRRECDVRRAGSAVRQSKYFPRRPSRPLPSKC